MTDHPHSSADNARQLPAYVSNAAREAARGALDDLETNTHVDSDIYTLAQHMEAFAADLRSKLSMAEGTLALQGIGLDTHATDVATMKRLAAQAIKAEKERDEALSMAKEWENSSKAYRLEADRALQGLTTEPQPLSMREALEPFAAFAEALVEAVPDDIAVGIYTGGAMHFGPSGGVNVGSLRKARAALALSRPNR